MKPTIKGIFVNSHIDAVRSAKGDAGFQKLQECMGTPVAYKNGDDIPVSEEVRLLECAVEILANSPVDPTTKQFEAGKLHFRNFTTTPLAKIIFSVFKSNFKLMMMQTKNIAGHVFNGVQFSSEELGEKSVKVTMENNDYPIDHFRGLFSEWMEFAGYKGTVEAKETAPNRYEYLLIWD